MLNYLLEMLALSLVLNIIGFIIAFKLKTDKLTDFSYALSFVILNGLALIKAKQYNNLPQIIMFSMVTLWSLRLGSYLVIRINKWGHDRRFDEMRSDFRKFLSFWVIQGFTVWAISLCSLLFIKYGVDKLNILSLAGVIVFLGALCLEASSDLQKFKFISDPKNKGKFIQTGLWARNRHPNYLGEIFVWVGVYIFAVSLFLEAKQVILALTSPLFIFIMIRFISGVPILERQANEKWGSSKAYQDYKSRSGLILFKHK
jgi:steroid 5-alpha reductase family enzyme